MPNALAKKPGGSPLTSMADLGQVAQPGKTTMTGKLKGPDPAATGNDYIDKGDHVGTDSFLTPEQRGRLTDLFHGRAIVAEQHYMTASSDARVDKLLAKEDTDLPWIASLMIDLALGFVAGKLITSAIALRNSHIEKIKEITGDAYPGQHVDLSFTSKVQQSVSRLTDDHLKISIGTTVANTKAQTLAHIAVARQGSFSEGKQASLDYLEQIRNIASLSFLQLREQMPVGATDAEMLVLFDGLHPNNHQIGMYTAEINAKLDRYRESQVERVRFLRSNGEGRYLDNGKRLNETSSKVKGDGNFRDENGNGEDEGTYVIWNKYVSGYPKQLVFEHGGKGGHTQGTNGRHGGAKGTNWNQQDVVYHTNPDTQYLVPTEFVEVAIMRHEATWGAIATETIDDSNWSWDPVRAAAATKNKGKQ